MNNAIPMLSNFQRLDFAAYCTEVLNEFCATTPGAQSATVATPDGVTLASTIHGKSGGDKISAMSSSISALAAALTREVSHAEPDRVLLESADGRIIFIKVPGSQAGIVFTAVTDHNTVLGALLWNCRSATEKLGSYLSALQRTS